jgi:hypothetical protein
VEENTKFDVLEDTKENYLRSSQYAEPQVNVLDEVPQSYSHQGNLELDQTKYTTKTQDHEYADLEVARLLYRVCALCEEEGHAITDCPFMPFHIRTSIVRHAKLQNVARALMDQSQDQEPKILLIQNRLRGMELGGQLGPQSRHIHPSIQFRNKIPKVYPHPHFAS